MTDCYYEKKDWRACTKEASYFEYIFNFPYMLITGGNSHYLFIDADWNVNLDGRF